MIDWQFAVSALQALVGLLWLAPAVYLMPRVVRSWQTDAHPERGVPVAFLAVLQVGFAVRWLAWPHSLGVMDAAELVTWATLYAFSGFMAIWFFIRALETRGR